MVEVLADLLLDAALVVGLRPAALVVLAGDEIGERLDLGQRAVGAVGEQPHRAAADQRDRPPRPAVADQRVEPGGVVDDHLAGDGVWQAQHLEQLGRTGGEQRQRVRALRREVVAAQEVAHAGDVVAQRDLGVVVERRVARVALRGVDQRRDLRCACRLRRERSRVEVHVDAEHLVSVRRLQRGQPAEPVVVEVVDLHVMSSSWSHLLSTGVPAGGEEETRNRTPAREVRGRAGSLGSASPPTASRRRITRSLLPQRHDLRQREAEPFGELHQHAERGIDLASLDRADVVAVQAASVAEHLLR